MHSRLTEKDGRQRVFYHIHIFVKKKRRGLNDVTGSGQMDEKTPDAGGKLVALSVLLTSLIIGVIGLYFILTNWRQDENLPISLYLAVLVVLLILLIVSMMRRVASGSSKPSRKEF